MRRFLSFAASLILAACLFFGFSSSVHADTVTLDAVSYLETLAAIGNSFLTENGAVPSGSYASEFLIRLDYLYRLYYDRSSDSPSVPYLYNVSSPGTDDYYGLFLSSGTVDISSDNVDAFLYAINNQIKIPADFVNLASDVSPTVLSSRQHVFIGYSYIGQRYGMFYYGYPVRDFASVYAVTPQPSSYTDPGFTFTAVNPVVGSAIVSMNLDPASFVAVVGCGRQDVNNGQTPVVFSSSGSDFPSARFEQVTSWNSWAVQPVSDLPSTESVSVNKINTSTGSVSSVSGVSTQYQFYANTMTNGYSYQYGSIILNPLVPYRLHRGSSVSVDGSFWGSDILSGTSSIWSEWGNFTAFTLGSYSAPSSETMSAILSDSSLIDTAAGINTAGGGSSGGSGSVDLSETNQLLQDVSDALNQGDPEMGSDVSDAVASLASEESDVFEQVDISEALDEKLDTSFLDNITSFAYIKSALESFYTSLGPVRDVVTFSLTVGAVAFLLGL